MSLNQAANSTGPNFDFDFDDFFHNDKSGPAEPCGPKHGTVAPVIPAAPSLDDLHNLSQMVKAGTDIRLSQLTERSSSLPFKDRHFKTPWAKNKDPISDYDFGLSSQNFQEKSSRAVQLQSVLGSQTVKSDSCHLSQVIGPSSQSHHLITSQISHDKSRADDYAVSIENYQTFSEAEQHGEAAMENEAQIGEVTPVVKAYLSTKDAYERANVERVRRPLFKMPQLTLPGEKPHAFQDEEDIQPIATPIPISSGTPRPWVIHQGATPGGSGEKVTLRSVCEIPQKYQCVFSEFAYFNIVQSKVLDSVLYTDQPLVLCAPTGSGKTVVFELAIVRLLLRMEASGPITNGKVVYMAPVKALCSERCADWSAKFGPLGLQCTELTGDTLTDEYYALQSAHVVLTTPTSSGLMFPGRWHQTSGGIGEMEKNFVSEKWDSMTRRWKDNRSLVKLVRLFLVDEVHLLNDASRGATMEAVVTRMKTVRSAIYRESESQTSSAAGLRFIAVSATIPNAEDIAEWLGSDDSTAISYKMGEEVRPVKLTKHVLGFPCIESWSEFRFDLSLNYKLLRIIQKYSDGKPTLVFCSTRKGAVQAAGTLAKQARFVMNGPHRQKLQSTSNLLRDAKLRELLVSGVGFHHAGIDPGDKRHVEDVFTAGELPVLFATSTLAMGVNLPAHLVIVKSTQFYDYGVSREYGDSQVLQMMGRAGRPQYDTTATAVILTKESTTAKYESLVTGKQLIESSLHKNLTGHLNAEIVLGTISDVSVALEWIRSTFLYIRVMKNPKHYGITLGLDKEQVERKLQDICMSVLRSLADCRLVDMDDDAFALKSTESGRLMARYYVAFETMASFHGFTGRFGLEDLVRAVAGCQEFRDIQLRANEKRALNNLNQHKTDLCIRFPMKGKMKSAEMKVNCLVQAALGCLPLTEFSLTQDTNRIFRVATRVSKCMVEFLLTQPCEDALHTFYCAVLLDKSLRAKLWENSKHVARQLEKIGPTLSNHLVNAGITSFEKISATNPRELEMVVNRHPPFGSIVKEAVSLLPKYELSVDQCIKYRHTNADVTVTVAMVNHQSVKGKSTTASSHACMLIVGDADNNIIYRQRLRDHALMETGSWSKKMEVSRASKSEELTVYLISEDWVGLDVQTTFAPFYTGDHTINEARAVIGAPLPRTVSRVCAGEQPGSVIEPRSQAPEDNCEDFIDLDWSTDEIGDSHAAIYHKGVDRERCKHRCANKRTCGHLCCKVGVPHREAPPVKMTAGIVARHVNEIRSKRGASPEKRPAKCSKIEQTPAADSLERFAYAPHYNERLSLSTDPSPEHRLQPPPTPRGWEDLDRYYTTREQDWNQEAGNGDWADCAGTESREGYNHAGMGQEDSYMIDDDDEEMVFERTGSDLRGLQRTGFAAPSATSAGTRTTLQQRPNTMVPNPSALQQHHDTISISGSDDDAEEEDEEDATGRSISSSVHANRLPGVRSLVGTARTVSSGYHQQGKVVAWKSPSRNRSLAEALRNRRLSGALTKMTHDENALASNTIGMFPRETCQKAQNSLRMADACRVTERACQNTDWQVSEGPRSGMESSDNTGQKWTIGDRQKPQAASQGLPVSCQREEAVSLSSRSAAPLAVHAVTAHKEDAVLAPTVVPPAVRSEVNGKEWEPGSVLSTAKEWKSRETSQMDRNSWFFISQPKQQSYDEELEEAITNFHNAFDNLF